MAAGCSSSSSYASRSSARPKYTSVRCQESEKPIEVRISVRAASSLLRPELVEEYRADAHDRRAFLDGDRKVLRRAHRELLETVLARQLAQRGEVRPARLGVVRERRHRHQPEDRDRGAFEEALELARRDPGLVLLARHVDLEQDPRRVRRMALELRQRRVRRDRVDQLDERRDLLDLAALQLADEVPAQAG